MMVKAQIDCDALRVYEGMVEVPEPLLVLDLSTGIPLEFESEQRVLRPFLNSSLTPSQAIPAKGILATCPHHLIYQDW